MQRKQTETHRIQLNTMASTENKALQTEKVEPSTKPMILALRPIADSLFEPFKALLDNLYESFPNTPSEPLAISSSLEETILQAMKDSAIGSGDAQIYQKIVLEVVILRLLSSIINDSYGQSNQNQAELSAKLFILLDISIYLTATTHDADIDLPFLVIHNIIVKNDKQFVLNHFQNYLFSNESRVRRNRLIHDCGVTSATKRPGTELLEIYKDVADIYSLKDEENLKFIGSLRIFISECFKVDEMSINNPDYAINKHHGTDKEIYNSAKRGRATPYTLYLKVRYQLTYPETMFTDRWMPRDCISSIYDLMDKIFDKDIAGKDYNVVWKNGSETHKKNRNELENGLLKTLAQNIQISPSFVITEDSFNDSFNNKLFRQFIIFQIEMMVNHIINYWESPSYTKSITVRSDMRKTKDFCLSVKKTIQGHYKKIDEQFFFTMNTISLDSNRFWVEWKASNFKVTRDTYIKEERIEKSRAAVSKNCKVRARHIPKYGTNEISRIWKLETGLKNLNQNTAIKNEQFEKLKDELSRLQNTLAFMEEDPDMYTPSEIADLKSKKEMLLYKALRLYRENGNWLSFSNTNHKLGLEGLFDTSLIAKFKEEQIQAKKEILEKEKEILDEDQDIVMETETVSQTAPTKTEKVEEDEDLDY